METVTIPDGFKGDTLECNAEPIGYWQDAVQLQVVTPGYEGRTRWIDYQSLNLLKDLGLPNVK